MITTVSKKQATLSISGRVIKGDQYGRTLGFPTANLDRRSYSRRKLKIRFGIYLGNVELKDSKIERFKNYPAGVIIGPLDKSGLPKLEAHLIGFKGNLYGKKITIILQKYLRPFKKFKSEESLKIQIKKDLNRIKKIIHGK
ncbi:MAG: riboflavin kinase [Candidatus Doudnabacteria bacterium]|jgi:riboflavin kinase/FMN adenylyltransferase